VIHVVSTGCINADVRTLSHAEFNSLLISCGLAYESDRWTARREDTAAIWRCLVEHMHLTTTQLVQFLRRQEPALRDGQATWAWMLGWLSPEAWQYILYEMPAAPHANVFDDRQYMIEWCRRYVARAFAADTLYALRTAAYFMRQDVGVWTNDDMLANDWETLDKAVLADSRRMNRNNVETWFRTVDTSLLSYVEKERVFCLRMRAALQDGVSPSTIEALAIGAFHILGGVCGEPCRIQCDEITVWLTKYAMSHRKSVECCTSFLCYPHADNVYRDAYLWMMAPCKPTWCCRHTRQHRMIVHALHHPTNGQNLHELRRLFHTELGVWVYGNSIALCNGSR
jgi:hypothetical protein